MENWLAVTLMVILLVIGSVGGAMVWSTETEVEVIKEIPGEEVIVEVEVPGENVTIEVEVPLDRDSIRAEGWDAVISEIGDEDDFLTCDGYEYDEDEVEVSKFYDDWTFGAIDLDDGEWMVNFTAKLRFDTEDDRACKEVREFIVEFEEGEDTEVDFITLI